MSFGLADLGFWFRVSFWLRVYNIGFRYSALGLGRKAVLGAYFCPRMGTATTLWILAVVDSLGFMDTYSRCGTSSASQEASALGLWD